MRRRKMSATSAAPSAPAAAAVDALVEALQLLDLSADALGHVLFRLPDAEDIARAAPACKAFSAAAKHATKLRADALPFPLPLTELSVVPTPGQPLHNNEPTLRAVRWAEAALRSAHTIAGCNFQSHVIGCAGTLYTWGGDGDGGRDMGHIAPIGVGERREPTLRPEEIVDPPAFRGLRSVVAHVSNSVCVDHDGNVWCWGENFYGQLGQLDMQPQWRPVKIGAEPSIPESMPRILQVAAGNQFFVLLTAKGEVRSFGFNMHGQLGLGHSHRGIWTHPLHFPPVTGFDGRRVVEISAGNYHCAVVDEVGGLWTWGVEDKGRLGLGGIGYSHDGVRNRPCRVMLLSRERIVHANAGSEHTLAVTEKGEVYGFGANQYGQLGVGDFRDKALPTLVTTFHEAREQSTGRLIDRVEPTPRVKQVSAGETHSVFLTETGEVYTMGGAELDGDGTVGMLGHGPTGELASTACQRPRKVIWACHGDPSLGGVPIKALEVKASSFHTLVRMHDSVVYSCGRGTDGMLGHGDETDRWHLTKILALPVDPAMVEDRA